MDGTSKTPQKGSADIDLANFVRGVDGYPRPGEVIKYFREQTIYTDPRDKRAKHWTQAELARQLDVSEATIRNMENRDIGLDSVEKRKTLAVLLNIPPMLLGLSSLNLLTEDTTATAKTASLSQTFDDETLIHLYNDVYKVYLNMYEIGEEKQEIGSLERWIQRIESDARETQNPAIVENLWNIHILAARIYGHDLMALNKASFHLNHALNIAEELHSPNMLASTRYWLADSHTLLIEFSNRDWQSAYSDFQSLVDNMKGANQSTKAAIYSYCSLTLALAQEDGTSKVLAQNMLDLAENLVEEKSIGNITFNREKFFVDKADTLLALGRYEKALEYIEQIEPLVNQRKKNYLQILKAEIHIKRLRPAYDTGIELLQEVLVTDKVEYHLKYVSRLLDILLASSYGRSPKVAGLRMALIRGGFGKN
jgi:transcriptional regulator with XRE-family HTH domain